MLDGLDEIADAGIRSKISKWADRQLSIHGGNRFIITSRPYGYVENPLSGVNVLDIRPLTSEQVSNFVRRWYVANEIRAQQRDDLGVRHDARAGALDLLGRLYDAPALSDLAVNPLLLTMIATVHRYRGSLPGRRVELYKEICDVSLGKRQQSKGIELRLTPAQKQRVLEPLAWEMMSTRKREISLEDACEAIKETLATIKAELDPQSFLVSVENDSSLLLEKEAGGTYVFAHLTFQEFLAACHAQNEPRRIDLLTENVGDGWWTECIRLFAAMGDATPILRACIAKRPLNPEALVLALQCTEEGERKDPAVEAELKRAVDVGLNENDPAVREPVAEACLAVRIGQMRPLGVGLYLDPNFISHAEYQLFVDQRLLAREGCRPVHWRTDRFPEGQGASPVLGLSFLDALTFCRWLTEREGGTWRFRLPWHQRENAPPDTDLNQGVAWTTTFGSDVPVAGPWPESIQARQREIARSERSLHRARNVALVARDLADIVLTDNGVPIVDDSAVSALTVAFDLAIDVRSELEDSLEPELMHVVEIALDRDLSSSLTDQARLALGSIDDLGSIDHLGPAVRRANALRYYLARGRPAHLQLLLLILFLHMGRPAYHPKNRLSLLIRARSMGFWTYVLWTLEKDQRSLSWFRRAPAFLSWFRRTPTGVAITAAEEAVLDLHMSIRLARARVTGADPPFEALQLVKERGTQTV